MAGQYRRVESHETEPFPEFEPSAQNFSSERNINHTSKASSGPDRHNRATSSSSQSSVSTDLELNHLDPQGADDVDQETGLSRESLERRRQLRDRNASIGGRSTADDLPELFSKDAGSAEFWRKVTINVTLILLWYLFSVSISVYNKWMFADKQLNFHFPLFTTSGHMIIQFVLASTVLLVAPRFRPTRNAETSQDSPAQRQQQVQQEEQSDKPIMSPGFYVTRIAPCAAATGLDIGLGNTSLRFVTLTFFTMCKSSTLGFVLAFAVVFRLEKLSWKLAGIIAIMTVGVIMMVAGETAFSSLGFILLMMASFFSGLRWSLTQILLRRNPATSNPFSSLFFLTPIMFVVLIIIAVPVEGMGEFVSGFSDLVDRKGIWLSIGILLTPGVLAFLMTSSEFALLKRTSVVTLSVCGIFKEVITIGAGGLFFDDQLTVINISGVLVTIIAIAAYNYIRMRKMKRQSVRQAQEIDEEQAPMLSTDTPDGPQRLASIHARRISTSDMISQSLRASTDVAPKATRHGKDTTSAKTPPLVKPPGNLD